MEKIDAKNFYNNVMPTKQGEDYERARWHHNAVASVGYEQTKNSILASLPESNSVSSVLEVGPGSGTWTKFLVKQYQTARLTLLDISSEMLNRTKATIGDREATYVESAFGDWQTTEKFDLFFSSRMLEYMEDKEAFVVKVKSVIKPGGKAIMVTKYPHYTRQKIQGKKIPDFHTGQIKAEALKKIFTKHGLVVRQVSAVTVSVPFFKSAALNKIVGSLVRALPLNPITNICVESYSIAVELPS